jgi:zinc/manganese transport system substrate-binding protein
MTKACSAMLFLASLLAASPPTGLRAETRPLPVVASFSILGDLVRHVGGERIALTILVGPDGDGHTFQPKPADAKAVAEARLVFVNGFGFEGWMPRLAKAAGGGAQVVEVTKGIASHTMAEDGDSVTDPHAWQSVANAKAMVANIRDGLVAAAPQDKAVFEANARTYLATLDRLEGEVRSAIASIPPDRRRIITSHDAFGYFSAAYGIAFIAPQGVSTEAEASAKAVAAIIRQIKAERIPAVFMENVTDPRLLERIADETGARIGGTLYSDALSKPEEGGGTYIEMMRHNIRELVGALGS